MVMRRPVVRDGATYIYRLVCPMSRVTRYIGKTSRPDIRLALHVSDARHSKRRHHRNNWIRSILESGASPDFAIMFRVPDGDAWEPWERFFIAAARAFDLPLTNSTGGGEGVKLTTPEVRQKWLAGIARANADPVVKERRRVAEQRCKADRLANASVYLQSAANRERASKHSRELWNRPDMKQRKKQNTKNAWAKLTPEQRAERCAKSAAGRKAAWAERGDKQRAKMQSQEFREKMAAVNKANWAARRAENLRRLTDCWETA